MTGGTVISMTMGTERGRRRHLSLVLALMLGLFASLIHCGNCDQAIAAPGTAIAAMDLDGTSPSDAPDQEMPVHSGHCLSHVTGQQSYVVQIPANVNHRLPAPGRAPALTSIAGLPLFKPPRA